MSPGSLHASLRRGVVIAAWISLASIPATAQSSRRPVCGCTDGRQFAVGASLFGKNSARVLITALRPEPPAAIPGKPLPPCTDIAVVGQAVKLLQVPDDRPFLKRQNLKRGIISNVCDTNIHFAEAKRTYDFFADDGSAVTLTDEDTNQTSPPDAASDAVGPDSREHEIDLNQDLTGKDLIQLIPSKLPDDDPSQSGFDSDDLKDGAYVIVRKRCKASVAPDTGPGGAGVSSTRRGGDENEVTISAGTLGKIEKRAGFRSEPLWIAEILPDSAPRPFWRTLMALPKGFAIVPELPRKVVLPSSQIVEINHFLDKYGVEWTRFGKELENAQEERDPGTNRLPGVYSPAALPLEENISIAQRAGVLEAIQSAATGVRLEFKDLETLARRNTLVLDDSSRDGIVVESSPHLLHRQCFVGLDRLVDRRIQPLAGPQRPALQVNRVDIKIFQPNAMHQVSSDYYAVDLEFQLRPNFGSGEVPVVCRFPSAPIDADLEQMAERILSSRFEIRRPGKR